MHANRPSMGTESRCKGEEHHGGDLTSTTARWTETSADRIEFAVFGVQPGISKTQADDHLADLMAFSLDYVLRGGVAVTSWLISN
jgi:hypothetical protein